MKSLAAAVEPLGVESPIEFAGGETLAIADSFGKRARLGAAALEAGPMSGRKRSRLIEKEEFRIASPHTRAGGP